MASASSKMTSFTFTLGLHAPQFIMTELSPIGLKFSPSLYFCSSVFCPETKVIEDFAFCWSVEHVHIEANFWKNHWTRQSELQLPKRNALCTCKVLHLLPHNINTTIVWSVELQYHILKLSSIKLPCYSQNCGGFPCAWWTIQQQVW